VRIWGTTVNQNSGVLNNFFFKNKQDTLTLDWNFFDPDFGFKFKHIFTTAPSFKDNVILTGSVLGNTFTKVSIKPKFNRYRLIFFIILFGVFSLTIGFSIFKGYDELIKSKGDGIAAFVIFFAITLIWSLFIYDYWNSYTIPF